MIIFVINKISFAIRGQYDDQFLIPGTGTHAGSWGDTTEFVHVPKPTGAGWSNISNDLILGQDNGSGEAEVIRNKTLGLSQLRMERDQKLALTDFTRLDNIITSGVLTIQQQTDWETYRQSCRNIAADCLIAASKEFDLDSIHSGVDIKLVADNIGHEGNDISLEVVDPELANQTLTLTFTRTGHQTAAIHIAVATDSSSNKTSTIQNIIDEINNDVNAGALVTASLSTGAIGSNVADTILSVTKLAGGSDALEHSIVNTPPATPLISGVN